jgi:MFS family permease
MRTWAPCLRHRHYRIYFYGQLANWFGTWIQQLALGWWAYKLSGSVGWLAAVGVCAQLPILLLGPWAASLADHIERRRGVMITQALSLAQAFALMILYFTGTGGVEAIVACSLFLGVVNTFDIPIRQSYAAHLIPQQDLRNAIAISSAAANFARLAAPSLGGFLIAWAGEGACFAVNTVSFLAILIALGSLPSQPAAKRRQDGVGALALFAQGARHAHGDPWIMSSMLVAGVLSLFATPYLTMMPALMSEAFHVGPELFGFAMGASGIGAMFAGIGMAAKPRMMGKRAMPWLGAMGAASLVSVAFAPSAEAAMPLLALAGFGLAGCASSANAIVQDRVDPAMRGRVMGLFSMCLYGAAPLGVVVMGWVAQGHGVRSAIAGGGALALISCVALGVQGVMRVKKMAASQGPMRLARQKSAFHEAGMEGGGVQEPKELSLASLALPSALATAAVVGIVAAVDGSTAEQEGVWSAQTMSALDMDAFGVEPPQG